jgi:hypothetical protein
VLIHHARQPYLYLMCGYMGSQPGLGLGYAPDSCYRLGVGRTYHEAKVGRACVCRGGGACKWGSLCFAIQAQVLLCCSARVSCAVPSS